MTSEAGEATRAAILAHLGQRPGASIRELADATGRRRTAIVHHLRILLRRGQVRCVRSGRHLLSFLPPSQPLAGVIGLLRLATARAIVEALGQDPGLSWRAVARRLGVTPRAVRYHVRRLGREGVLTVEERDGGRRALIHPAARGLLEGARPPGRPELAEAAAPVP